MRVNKEKRSAEIKFATGSQQQHLDRDRKGIDYAAHPPGIDHDLALVYKGFREDTLPGEFRQIASNVVHRRFFLRDWGFDLRPYGVVARLLTHRYFCFLNSLMGTGST